jgi:tRNA modification GTPase
MRIEAALDFSRGRDRHPARRRTSPLRLGALRADLAALVARARAGSRLRSGLHVVLAGLPNVGKSSLLNRLSGEDQGESLPRWPGTTRDVLREAIQIEGIPDARDRYRRSARYRRRGGERLASSEPGARLSAPTSWCSCWMRVPENPMVIVRLRLGITCKAWSASWSRNKCDLAGLEPGREASRRLVSGCGCRPRQALESICCMMNSCAWPAGRGAVRMSCWRGSAISPR